MYLTRDKIDTIVASIMTIVSETEKLVGERDVLLAKVEARDILLADLRAEVEELREENAILAARDKARTKGCG